VREEGLGGGFVNISEAFFGFIRFGLGIMCPFDQISGGHYTLSSSAAST
jgi:hypothetical protein